MIDCDNCNLDRPFMDYYEYTESDRNSSNRAGASNRLTVRWMERVIDDAVFLATCEAKRVTHFWNPSCLDIMNDNPDDHPSQRGGGGGGTFQDGVAASLMATEELRQTFLQEEIPSSQQCLEVRHRMEEMVGILFSIHPADDVENDLKGHCHSRIANAALEAVDFVTSKSEQPQKDILEVEREVQGAVARMVELALILHDDDKVSQKEISKIYTAYQRKVIRQRVTPSITELVARRKWNAQHSQEGWAHRAQEEDDDDDDDDGNGGGQHQKATHLNVITGILSQASALIHPLIMWTAQLPPREQRHTPIHDLCDDAIAIIDNQAQTLTQTVASWWIDDKRVDEFWMGKSADETPCGTEELSELYSLVDELAFLCQIFDRYITLLKSERRDDTRTVIGDLHAEWTWKYASLERYLTTQQMLSALRLAHPVQIVLGTPIHVPSVVEDAQYLSTRALERASSARSSQAIGTVAHAVASNVWSTDASVSGGVHQALVDQRGCYNEDRDTNNATAAISSAPSTGPKSGSNAFANALMGALDDDLGPSSLGGSPSKDRPPPAPTSGSFFGLGALSSALPTTGEKVKRIQIETHLCAMNGIHSASAACVALVRYLDTLLPGTEHEDDAAAAAIVGDDKSFTMIQLAREELSRFSKEYQFFLETQASRVVSEFCGSVHDLSVYRGECVLPILRYYLERENYNIPSAEILQPAEDDALITQKYIQPFQESAFFQMLGSCDADVLIVIYGEVSSRLVDLFFDVLTSDTVPKFFTDWGSLLLSKQVRMIQNFISKAMEGKLSDRAVPTMPQWERLLQAVNVLQLEKPSDWSFYEKSSTLTPHELRNILSLRKDFSKDAIAAVVASSKGNGNFSTC